MRRREWCLPAPPAQDGGAAAPAGPPAGLLLPVSTASVDFFDLAGQQDARSRAAAGGELLLPGGGGAAGGAAGGQPLDLSQGLALPREPGKALEGLWFTLAALPQDKELMALIRWVASLFSLRFHGSLISWARTAVGC